MLEQPTAATVAPERAMLPVAPGSDAVAAVAERIARAARPVLMIGGDIKSDSDRAALRAAAEAWRLPVLGAFKRHDAVDNDHPLWAGGVPYVVPKALAETLAESDLVIAVGARLNDVTSQNYAFPRAPVPAQPLIHVYPDPERIGRNFATELGLVANAGPFLAALAQRNAPPAPAGREAWIERLVALDRKARALAPENPADGVDFGHIAVAIGRRLPPDGIVTTDAGSFAGWIARHVVFKPPQRFISWISGAMGGGIPSAVAAALRYPGRTVVAAVGDGGILMNGSELATAMATGAAIKVFVSNNGVYGTIRMHQGRSYPGRRVATALVNPDFAAWARSFGATGLTVTKPEEADAAVREALATPGPVVVDVRTSPTLVAPGIRLAD